MSGKLDFVRPFHGGKKKLIDRVVSLALSLGPEHTDLSLFCTSAFQENAKLVSCLSHFCRVIFHFYVKE